jgi:hypothetical protein
MLSRSTTREVRRGFLMMTAVLGAMALGDRAAAGIIVTFQDENDPPTKPTVAGTSDYSVIGGGVTEHFTVTLNDVLSKPASLTRTESFYLLEPAAEGGGLSDIIEFTTIQDSQRLIIDFLSSDLLTGGPNPYGNPMVELPNLQVIPLPPDLPALSDTVTVQVQSLVPEPLSLVMMGTGAFGLLGYLFVRRARTGT